MTQTDKVLANLTFPPARVKINAVFESDVTNNSGPLEPTAKFANMFWADTAKKVLFRRNVGNSAWINERSLEPLYVNKTANYTFQEGDNGKKICFNDTGATSVEGLIATLPDASVAGVGWHVLVIKINANNTNYIRITDGVTINVYLDAQYETALIISTGSAWQVIKYNENRAGEQEDWDWTTIPEWAYFKNGQSLSTATDFLLFKWAGTSYTPGLTHGTLTSLIESGGIATATLAGHGFLDGETKSVSWQEGGTGAVLHRGVKIFNVDTDTFDFSLRGFPETPTGTIKIYSVTTFDLPDVRGHFPRYQDAGAGIDPDAATRTARADGQNGDAAGTTQTGLVDPTGLGVGGRIYYSPNGTHAHNNDSVINGRSSLWESASGYQSWAETYITGGGAETRPINIYKKPLIRKR